MRQRNLCTVFLFAHLFKYLPPDIPARLFQRQALFSIALVLFLFIMLINIVLNTLLKRKKG